MSSSAQHQELPTWDILNAYFMGGGGCENANPLVKHQIESYNEFIDKKLVQIIQGFNPIQIFHNYNEDIGDFMYKININILQPSITKPMYQTSDGSQLLMTPHTARMNNLTYAVNLYTDIHVVTDIINQDGITERTENTVPSVCIGRIPMMVRSKGCILTQMPNFAEGSGKYECRYDPGGYFIINGNEKVVICQDRISENKMLVFAPTTNSDGLSAEIRSIPDGIFLPPKTTSINLSAKPNHLGHIIRMNTTFLRSEIPVFTMFRALGIETDKDIISYIVYDMDNPKNQRIITELLACCEDGSDVHTMEDAHEVLLRLVGTTGTPREYLEKPDVAREILHKMIVNDFLPHVGPSFRRKAMYLGYMVRKLLSTFLGYQEYDNRDSYLHKRIDTTGVLMSNLFRQCYSKMVKEMRNLVTRELNLWRANSDVHTNLITSTNVHKFFKPTLLETGMRYALSTGNWGVKTIGTFQNIRQGVAQVLNRMSYLSTLSHLRRINTPMEKSGKLIQPRKLENSQFGMICPAETPEGSAVGLVKNMAMSTQITIGMSSAYIRTCIEDLGTHVMTDDLDEIAARTFVKNMGSENVVHVIVNGDLVGYHPNPVEFYNKLKSLKRQGVIAPTTSIVWNIKMGNIIISTEAGRMCRPLYIVDEAEDEPPKKSRSKKIKMEDLSEKKRVLRVPPERGEKWTNIHGHKSFIEFVAPLHSGKYTEGFIELMDTDEIDKAMIAMTPKDLERGIKGTTLPPCYTHCEIHPSLLNGVLAVNIPFSDHNQSPRNCYQCLWEEEPVLMANGEWKSIKDVHVNDHVVCFHPITMDPSITHVVHQYVRPNKKSMVLLITSSGRSIRATKDHKIMTNIGWVEAGNFCLDTTRALVGIQIGVPDRVAWGYMLTNENNGNNRTIDLGSLEEGIRNRLSEMGLYPLVVCHPKMPVISRMVGWKKQGGVFGHRIDQNAFNDDAKYLGFIQYKSNDSALKALLDALSMDMDWAKDISLLSKREMMAAYLGAREKAPNVFQFDDWVTDVLPDMTVLVPPIDYSLVYKFGCRYNTMLMIEFSRLDEYVRYADYMKTRGIGNIMKKEEWLQIVNVVGNTMFVPVFSCTGSRNCMISDITVESENHSFIGGSCFTVSNSAMGKQAVGVYMSNFNHRIDTMAHILNYPQKPLVNTKLSKYTNSDTMPSGINAVVAIMTYTGFNMEDSVMINQSALDRGLFTSTYYKSYRDQCNKNHSTGEEEVFSRPDTINTANMKPYNYDKLGNDGFVPKNTEIDGNDILVGKIMPHKVHGIIYPRDTSMSVKANDEGFVDMNYTGSNGEGYRFCKVRIRKYRKPVIGDKVACYTDDHDILTKRGWVGIADLKMDDWVASMVDKKLVYQQPTELQKYDYEGKMYQIKSNHIDLFVTANHRMYVKKEYRRKNFEMVLADELVHKRGVAYKKNVDEWTPDIDDQEYPWNLVLNDKGKITHFRFEEYIDKRDNFFPEFEIPIDDWLTIYGIYVAEGTAYSNNIGYAAYKPRVQKALDIACANTPFKVGKYLAENKERVNWHWMCVQAAKFIGTGIIAPHKRLPEWVWYLERHQCKKLIQSMCLGDGGIMENGTWRYYTSSTGLADDFQRLCLHAGFSCNKKLKSEAGTFAVKKDGEVITQNYDYLVLTIITSQNEPRVNKNINSGHEPHDELVDYSGKVYCCTVPKGDGIIYVRRNGTPIWSGNSRHAQKGTIGMIYSQEDMPFTKDGIIPDVILNPHAIPSRMTIAQLMECIMGKACAHLGSFGDATPFEDCNVESIASMLEKSGMERYGNEIMYHGRTGQQIHTEIFIGPTFYQRLKHMVADKAFSRGSNGPVVLLTRQPAEGRARNGGLRFGEMERDVLIAYGSANFLKERILDSSDNYACFICKRCGLLCTANPAKNMYKCTTCKNDADIVQIRIPYSMKLLLQELMTMSVAARMITG